MTREADTGARPVAGVIACTRDVRGEPAQAVMNRYVDAVARYAQAWPLLVPSLAGAVDAHAVAARLDGLLLTGSPSNVEPWRYDEAGPAGEGPFDADRDELALTLTHAMLAQGKPVFGVCRGFQELNVAFGGALRRDVGAAEPLPHHAAEGADLPAMFAHTHDVSLAPGGVLARGLGHDRLRVNSVHYQGVARLGDGLTPEAWAPDGLVEAFSAAVGGAQLLAVQWHPEWAPDADADSAAFFRLFGEALRRRAAPPSEGHAP